MGASIEQVLLRRLVEPCARADLGPGLGASGTVTAMMDVTDGLGGSLRELAAASAVRLIVDAEAIPMHPGVVEVSQMLDMDPLAVALGIGLELELIGCLRSAPPPHIDDELTVIGEAVDGDGVVLRRSGILEDIPRHSWEHFTEDALAQVLGQAEGP